jgi:hypothetical protein
VIETVGGFVSGTGVAVIVQENTCDAERTPSEAQAVTVYVPKSVTHA